MVDYLQKQAEARLIKLAECLRILRRNGLLTKSAGTTSFYMGDALRTGGVRGGLIGGLGGAAVGALVDKKKRWRGALKGGLLGALLGGSIGTAHHAWSHRRRDDLLMDDAIALASAKNQLYLDRKYIDRMEISLASNTSLTKAQRAKREKELDDFALKLADRNAQLQRRESEMQASKQRRVNSSGQGPTDVPTPVYVDPLRANYNEAEDARGMSLYLQPELNDIHDTESGRKAWKPW